MQKSSAFVLPPAASLAADQHPPQQLHHPHPHHPHHPHPQHHAIIPSNSTRPGSISEVPAYADYSMMDDSSVSHRASISTDENSNDSPESWDGEGPDSSPVADVEVKIHDISHPLAMASAKFQFNMVAPHESDLSMGDVTPKVEEVDDADDLQSIKPMGVDPMANADSTHPDSTALPVNVPRKRGRPRKHPLPAPGGQVKITKGRSKTGCITCRRRKKKCDETKPT